MAPTTPVSEIGSGLLRTHLPYRFRLQRLTTVPPSTVGVWTDARRWNRRQSIEGDDDDSRLQVCWHLHSHPHPYRRRRHLDHPGLHRPAREQRGGFESKLVTTGDDLLSRSSAAARQEALDDGCVRQLSCPRPDSDVRTQDDRESCAPWPRGEASGQDFCFARSEGFEPPTF